MACVQLLLIFFFCESGQLLFFSAELNFGVNIFKLYGMDWNL